LFSSFGGKYLAFSLSFGVPIVIHLLSGVMHSSIDRAILADMVSVAELGLYTLGYQVGMVMAIVTTSVNKAWQPSYYEVMESNDPKKDHHIRRTYNLWLIVMSLICTLGILWGGDILKLITPQNFHGASVVIPYVLLGYFFHGLYYFAVSPIFFHKRTILLPIFTGAAAALVNIGLNFLLIPYLGITGAALATTISMFFQALVVYIVGRRLHNHGFNLLATGIVSLAMLTAFIGPLYVDDFVQSQAARVTSATILLAIIYTFFKHDIIAAFSSVTRKQQPL
jgi:O-antigen/teichoic acid export membrane protein